MLSGISGLEVLDCAERCWQQLLSPNSHLDPLSLLISSNNYPGRPLLTDGVDK